MARGPVLAYVASGCIRTGGGEMAARLQVIFESAARLVEQYQPDEVSIERVFMHRNADSALKLGQARGAALCATFGSEMRVYEYAPREVKRAVVGTGAAEKAQVQMMVTRILGLDRQPAADAADALAIALCHAHARTATTLVAAAGRRWR
jgi:crossover junction endodeoxyribonuclease RuvC